MDADLYAALHDVDDVQHVQGDVPDVQTAYSALGWERMSEIPGEVATVQIDMQAVRTVVSQLVDVWTLFLTFYAQIFMLNMLFGLLQSFIHMIRLPPLGGVS